MGFAKFLLLGIISLSTVADAVVINVQLPNATEPLSPNIHVSLPIIDWHMEAPSPVVITLWPHMQVDFSDNDLISLAVISNPESWLLCTKLYMAEKICSHLVSGYPGTMFETYGCKGFYVPRAAAFNLSVWLEQTGNSSIKQKIAQHNFLYDRSPKGSVATSQGHFLDIEIPRYNANRSSLDRLISYDESFDSYRRTAQNFVVFKDNHVVQAENEEPRVLQLDKSHGEWKGVMDHMLSHLSKKMFCKIGSLKKSNDILSRYGAKDQKEKERPARVLVLGDSHSKLFFSGFPIQGNDEKESTASNNDPQCSISNYCVCVVPGASMYGLKNNNSSSNASLLFNECLRQAFPVDAVLVALGEVDSRYLAYHRGLARGITILEQIHDSIKSLAFFVDKILVRQEGFRIDQVIVMAVPMKCPHGDRDERLLVYRNTVHSTLLFNDELEDFCSHRGCSFAQSTDDLFDYVSSQVSEYFWSWPLDMHCSPQRMFFFWHRAVKRASQFRWCGEGVSRQK